MKFGTCYIVFVPIKICYFKRSAVGDIKILGAVICEGDRAVVPSVAGS
jgi:hypothetical protein